VQELKGSYQPVIALALLTVVGYGPRVLQEPGGNGMGVSIRSYNGRIQFCIITDAGLMPDRVAVWRRVRQAHVAYPDEPVGRGGDLSAAIASISTR
jgi:hypothetical protein